MRRPDDTRWARGPYTGAMEIVFRASIAQGVDALSVNPLRTALATLGVIMGIASVIATLALADGVD